MRPRRCRSCARTVAQPHRTACGRNPKNTDDNRVRRWEKGEREERDAKHKAQAEGAKT